MTAKWQCSATTAPLKERTRFLADFAVAAKEPQWQCTLKSTPSFELLVDLLDSPDQHHAYYYRHTDTQTFVIFVTQIPDRIFILTCCCC
jgi:hypothetical protein